MSISSIGSGLAPLLPKSTTAPAGQAGGRQIDKQPPPHHHGTGKPPVVSDSGTITAGEAATTLDQIA